jgi:RHS repeat-associated protein
LDGYSYSSGTLLNQISYDSFGNLTNQTNASVTFRFGYTGREFDSETGQYYYRARYYDPKVGRFTSEDPIGFSAGDTNLSRYVFNSPTNFTDPSGELVWWVAVPLLTVALLSAEQLRWPRPAQTPTSRCDNQPDMFAGDREAANALASLSPVGMVPSLGSRLPSLASRLPRIGPGNWPKFGNPLGRSPELVPVGPSIDPPGNIPIGTPKNIPTGANPGLSKPYFESGGGSGGVLDDLPGKTGKTGPIKEVPNAEALDDLFDSLGGKTVNPGRYPGIVKELPDGTIIRRRSSSKSGGPTLDITMPDGKIIKVHTKS